MTSAIKKEEICVNPQRYLTLTTISMYEGWRLCLKTLSRNNFSELIYQKSFVSCEDSFITLSQVCFDTRESFRIHTACSSISTSLEFGIYSGVFQATYFNIYDDYLNYVNCELCELC